MLLDCKADVNVESSTRLTAVVCIDFADVGIRCELQVWAARRRDRAMVQLLIEHGGDARAPEVSVTGSIYKQEHY